MFYIFSIILCILNICLPNEVHCLCIVVVNDLAECVTKCEFNAVDLYLYVNYEMKSVSG